MLTRFIQLDKSDIESLPIKPGSIIVSKDSKELMFDTQDKQRIRIGDLIYLEKETNRISLLTPMPEKLYYVKETNMIWYYDYNTMSWQHSTPTRNSLGISNVDNTADKDKHVAYAYESGIVNGHTVNSDVPEDAKFTDTTYELATTMSNGLMSHNDKSKLDSLNRVSMVSQLSNDAGYITEDATVAAANKLASSRNIILNGELTGSSSFDGTQDITISASIKGIDASKITSGTIDIDRLPKGALERLVVVSTDEDRFDLTTDYVQVGDTVKVTETGIMYFVKDESKLNTEAGYEEYAAGMASSVEWSGVQNKPLTFTPSTHTHSITEVTDASTVARTGSYNDLNNKPVNLSEFVNDNNFITTNDANRNYMSSATITFDSSNAYLSITKNSKTSTTATLSKVVVTGSYNDLVDTPTIPTKFSELTNDMDLADKTYVLLAVDNAFQQVSEVGKTGRYNDLKDKPSIPTTMSELSNDVGYLTKSDTIDLAKNATNLNNGDWHLTVENGNIAFKYRNNTVATLNSSGIFTCSQIVEK